MSIPGCKLRSPLSTGTANGVSLEVMRFDFGPAHRAAIAIALEPVTRRTGATPARPLGLN
jgi:hypothetical protein